MVFGPVSHNDKKPGSCYGCRGNAFWSLSLFKFEEQTQSVKNRQNLLVTINQSICRLCPFSLVRNKELRSANDAFNIMQKEKQKEKKKKGEKMHLGHAVYCSLVF